MKQVYIPMEKQQTITVEPDLDKIRNRMHISTPGFPTIL